MVAFCQLCFKEMTMMMSDLNPLDYQIRGQVMAVAPSNKTTNTQRMRCGDNEK